MIKDLHTLQKKIAYVPTMSIQAKRKSKAFWVAEIPLGLQRGYVSFIRRSEISD